MNLLKVLAAVSAAVTIAGQAAPGAQAGTGASNAANVGTARERLLLDFGWRFHLGHANDPSKDFGFGANPQGTFAKTGNMLPAARQSYDDSSWKPVDLPHDWAIELPFENAPELTQRGSYPLGRAYPATSVGWYRRVFEIPAADAGKRISIEFDGVYRQAMVIFNDHYIGENFSGYAPFSFDVTDFVNVGGDNVLLVRVDATLSDGWFYEGAGIYRHVWLTKTNPAHVAQWGTFARSEVRAGEATVSIRTEVNNHGGEAKDCRVISTIVDPAGKVAGQVTSAPVSIPAWKQQTYEQQVIVTQPALWSLEQPNLYKLVTEVEVGGSPVDRYETTFGIRTLAFDPDRGFFLNGKPVKIKGTCNHQDHAGVGSALPDRIQYYRIERLKEMGSNAYRTSHNPPTPELLDACDRLGMLVMDETRMMSSNPEGLSQLERFVRRDRNRPSVFMWSLGNEEMVVQATERGARIVASMKRLVDELDGSRPCTVGFVVGSLWGKGVSKVVDVQGCNYFDNFTDKYHEEHPGHPMIGAENVSAISTRGIYRVDKEHGYVAAYDGAGSAIGRGSAERWWSHYDARPYLAGGFVWTGFDYRGEPSPYRWPCISSHYGILDTCGFPKDTFFYYQSWWGSQPVLHLFPHWNWEGREGQEIEVWVYSNLDRVELFLNGQSLGVRDMKQDSHLDWKVKYAPGVLEARGFQGGEPVLTARRETTGPAAKLELRPDRHEISADGEDVSMVAVEVQDPQGHLMPAADNPVTFTISGSGRLIGVGNGNPSSHESDKGDQRRAFNGLCMAIVQASKQPGDLVVEASSPGLAPAVVKIRCHAAALRAAVPPWQPKPVETGPGIVGLWKTIGHDPMGSATIMFKRAGNKLTGTIENDVMGVLEIEDGKIDGDHVSFTGAFFGYSGKIHGDELTLRIGTPGGEGDESIVRPPLTLKKVK